MERVFPTFQNDVPVVICAHCRKVRDQQGDWREHKPDATVILSHGVCPACIKEHYSEIPMAPMQTA